MGVDVLFLYSDKKSTKRNRLGGGADRKVFRYCGGYLAYAPNLEPPSPQTPSRPPSRRWAVVDCCKVGVLRIRQNRSGNRNRIPPGRRGRRPLQMHYRWFCENVGGGAFDAPRDPVATPEWCRRIRKIYRLGIPQCYPVLSYQVRHGRILKEGVFGARQRDSSASLSRLLSVPFLFGHKKGTYPPIYPCTVSSYISKSGGHEGRRKPLLFG